MARETGYRVRELYMGVNSRYVTDRYVTNHFDATQVWNKWVGGYVCALSPVTITRPHPDIVRIDALDKDDDPIVISVSFKRVTMSISKENS